MDGEKMGADLWARNEVISVGVRSGWSLSSKIRFNEQDFFLNILSIAFRCDVAGILLS